MADKVKIGLEVHAQLTAVPTKLFCACPSDYRDSEPNTTICPVCFGLPGALPVVSRQAVECAVMVGLALNCKIAERTSFYRKNYFYPDLSKNYQTSQYDKGGGVPVATGGYLDLEGRRIRVRRVQLEEDPGKLTYEGTIEQSTHSLVDYNRAGVPLVEIVTEPDLASPKEAKVFLDRLRSILESLGVSDGELEGAMRCDANISLGSDGRVEVKNISSFKEVEKALSYEALRQEAFAPGERHTGSETRHWDERRSVTVSLRTKEEEQDYRYFPEPDLLPIELGEEAVKKVKRVMPELPAPRAARYVRSLGIQPQVARELSGNRVLSEFFEACLAISNEATELANGIVGELAPHAATGKVPLPPKEFCELVSLVKAGRITRAQSKAVLEEAIASGRPVAKIVESTGVAALADEGAIRAVVERVVSARPELLRDARASQKAFSFAVGQVLKEEPKAEPKLVAKELARLLGKA